MTSKQQHNNLNAHTNPRENFKKNFFWKYNTQKNFKKIYTIFFSYPKYAWNCSGDSPPILFTFENFGSLKTPFLRFFRFCTFLWAFSESRARYSDCVQIFILFRTIIYAIYRYYNLKLCLLTIYLIDSQIVMLYISKMPIKK